MSQQIDAAYMETAANDASALADTLANDAKNLMGNIEPMVTGLQGAAGRTFQSLKTTLEEQLKIIDRALEDIAVGIRTTGRDIDSSDQVADSDLASAFQNAGGDDAASILANGR